MILITGAGGKTDRTLVKALSKTGSVCVFVYRAEHVSVLQSLDADQGFLTEKEEIKDWRLRSKGISEYAVENLSRMFEYYNHWGLSGNPNILRWLLRREATSLETFIERTLKERNAVN